MIGIVNYGSGNVYAVSNIYNRLNIPNIITNNFEELRKVTHLILPGVGAFDETMQILYKSGMKSFLDELVLEKRKPILGICVGMQLLAEGSEEGDLAGFGWIKGYVRKFDHSKMQQKPYLPHLGWNAINIKRKSAIFNNVDPEKGFYFLHSYYFECQSSDNILTTTDYGITYASAVTDENVYGMQFHPEKSHQNGITVFKNYFEL